MADLVTIFNQALANIGSTSLLQGPVENSKASSQCNLWWPQARDTVLRAYPWPFATLTVTLAQIPPATYQPPDWLYAFAYPADALKALEILSPAGQRPPPRLRVPFIIRALPPVGGGTSRALLTNLAPGLVTGVPGSGQDIGNGSWSWWQPTGLQPGTLMPCLRYISQITDTTAYPPEVATVMAWQLAAFLAMPMTQQKGLKEDAEKMVAVSMRSAAALNLNEMQDWPPQESETQMARGGGYDNGTNW